MFFVFLDKLDHSKSHLGQAVHCAYTLMTRQSVLKSMQSLTSQPPYCLYTAFFSPLYHSLQCSSEHKAHVMFLFSLHKWYHNWILTTVCLLMSQQGRKWGIYKSDLDSNLVKLSAESYFTDSWTKQTCRISPHEYQNHKTFSLLFHP